MPLGEKSILFGMNNRLQPGRRALRGLTMLQQTTNHPIQPVVTSQKPPVILSSVRRCLFGVSQPEDTENLLKVVTDDACEKFVEKYDFDPREYRPVSSGSARFEWEVVDENDWRPTNSVLSEKTILDPTRSIGFLALNQRNERISKTPGSPTQKSIKKVAKMMAEKGKNVGLSSNSPGIFKKPLAQLQSMNGGNRQLGSSSKQTVLSDYMTPRKRKMETKKPTSPKMAKNNRSPKRAKIADYFKTMA